MCCVLQSRMGQGGPSAGETLRAWLLSALVVHGAVAGNPDAKRLYDDLLSNYNKLVRPVVNTTDVLRVCIKLKLSQLIDVVSTTTQLRFFCRPSPVSFPRECYTSLPLLTTYCLSKPS